MRRWAGAAMAVVGAVAAVVVPMSSASAAPTGGTAADSAGITFVPGTTGTAEEVWGTVKHGATGACLTNTHRDYIYLSICDANRNDQKWTWTGWYGSHRFLKSMHTTWCLDGNQHGGRIYAEPCNGGPYQAWSYDYINTMNIIQWQSDWVLDGNGSSVYLSPQDAPTNHYQKWY